jgi:hypothetical protein
MNGRMNGYEEREGGSQRKKKENFITNSYILL